MNIAEFTLFVFGMAVGVLLSVALIAAAPGHIRFINEHLVQDGMAYYHPTTGDVVWIKPNK